jgi:hypothetical protein
MIAIPINRVEFIGDEITKSVAAEAVSIKSPQGDHWLQPVEELRSIP